MCTEFRRNSTNHSPGRKLKLYIFVSCQNALCAQDQTALIMVTTRVAPLKTLPRLEVVAAAVGARLFKNIIHDVDETYLWSADLLTRSMTSGQFISNKLWLNGSIRMANMKTQEARTDYIVGTRNLLLVKY